MESVQYRGDESHHTVHYGIVLWSFSSYTIRKEPKHIQQRKRTIYPVWIDLNWNIQESFLYSYVPSSSLDTSTPSCGPSHFRRFCYLSNAPTPIPSTASIMALPMTPGPPTIPCFRLSQSRYIRTVPSFVTTAICVSSGAMDALKALTDSPGTNSAKRFILGYE